MINFSFLGFSSGWRLVLVLSFPFFFPLFFFFFLFVALGAAGGNEKKKTKKEGSLSKADELGRRRCFQIIIEWVFLFLNCFLLCTLVCLPRKRSKENTHPLSSRLRICIIDRLHLRRVPRANASVLSKYHTQGTLIAFVYPPLTTFYSPWLTKKRRTCQ